MTKDKTVVDVVEERKSICARIMRCYKENVARVEVLQEERESLNRRLQVYALRFMERQIIAELHGWDGKSDVLTVEFSWGEIYQDFLAALPATEKDSIDRLFPDGFSLHKEGQERVQSDVTLLFGVLKSEGINLTVWVDSGCEYGFRWSFFLPNE